MKKCLMAILQVVLLATSEATWAQTKPATTEPANAKSEVTGDGKPSVTAHQITIDGRGLSYHATTGLLAIKDEAGKPKASMFFVAYNADGFSDSPATRPITFCFNGGPGAAAVWLHIGGVGPKSIALDDHDLPVGPPYKMQDNPATWLGSSDLVFIDPVSTGYSRPAPGEKAEQFHGVHEDIVSVAEFIRLYLTQYRRWASPKYIAGESYGTTRAAALAGYLADHDGIAVNGIVLVSSVLDFQALNAGPGNDEPFKMYLPSFAAVAWYHKKLSPELQTDLNQTIDKVRNFVADEYGPALPKGAALAPEKRAEIVKQIAAFSGLPAELVERSNLRIDPSTFEKELLGDGHKIIGRFDGRITGYDADASELYPHYDPSLSRYLPAYTASFNDYVRSELKFESDLPYEVLTSVQPWSFGQEGGGYLYVIDDLQSAILKNPKLRVMFVSGYFDLATPFSAADHAINRMMLGPDLKGNITHEYVPTGHMVYHNKEAARKIAEAVGKFVAE